MPNEFGAQTPNACRGKRGFFAPAVLLSGVSHQILSILIIFTFAACGGKAKPVKITAANVFIGDCVDPSAGGVLSPSPSLRAAHQDLDGDGRKEKVFADQNLCRNGNCYWNLFAESKGCFRYIGTIAGATLEVLDSQADAGFYAIRGWWKLSSGSRQLVQSYRFRAGGYQLTDVLVCRQTGDDRLLCAAEEQDVAKHAD